MSSGERRVFPQLPIVQVDPLERRPPVDKYGSFRWVSLAGLAAFAGLIGWFAWSAWSMRDVWSRVYVLHDASRAEAERIEAAWRLAHDPRVEPGQLRDQSLERGLPPLARAIMAEGMGPEALAEGPRAFALAVARSEGWPDWLRLLHLEVLADAAGEGEAVDGAALGELARHPDPIIRLWAAYARAEAVPDDRAAVEALERARGGGGEVAGLAELLVGALRGGGEREEGLERARGWTRAHHRELAEIWRGWEVVGGELRRMDREGE